MAVERNVQQQTGQTVRTLEITALQGDGSVATVEMQVITISDKLGNVLDFGKIERLLERVVELGEDIFHHLEVHA